MNVLKPIFFDFSTPVPPPDWVIDDVIEREAVTMVSGDSGTGKSTICNSMQVAILKEEPWLNHPTHGTRVMVIDEENNQRLVQERMAALGMTNVLRENLRYFCRQGVRLGDDEWLPTIIRVVEDFEPDVIFVDTVAKASGIDLNDNSAVTQFYGDLHPILQIAPVVLQHHESKGGDAARRASGQAMMGARQWSGQAEFHMSINKLGPVEKKITADGDERLRYPLELEAPKARHGGGSGNKRIAIVSSGRDGVSTRMRVMPLDEDWTPAP